mmetsp:Transcript_7126/g.20115  ORF Transcript_7126/g.20115 Transcript_7126/m.20115 type:complete len:488 (-) Transcript_7126:361-1824(-)|eukprot:CAMPEP_0117668840 /NCGR_PEP_ID=MMETSP0804-20121206/11781_1 /TAXON_ID=1074897 /ORGANISM="Tetraselmis astigmatica, Strain CCMP880" /LENGTH=487 /DNA_ID=CAMNT_0005476793 /DNA_START=198 /DNA_END=1661 /DNA_ORIENTATION=-
MPVNGSSTQLLDYYLFNTRPRHSEEGAEPEPAPSEFSTTTTSFLEVRNDKLSIKYTGNASHSNDVGSIQANRPLPKDRLVYYYEVTVLSGGESSKIGIGFADDKFKSQRQPGWEPNSYGYHGDDGHKFGSGSHDAYGPLYSTGDVVGAGIHLGRGEIFFTVNGRHLGLAFSGVKAASLYPTIGLHSPGEKIEANFGQRPFLFDFEAFLEAERQNNRKAVSREELPAGASHKIVRDFLVHFGYGATLAAFDAAAGTVESGGSALANGKNTSAANSCNGAENDEAEPMTIDSNGGIKHPTADEHYPGLSLRMQIRSLLSEGHAETAVSLLQAQHPKLMEPSSPYPEVPFFLHCQRFIEMIRAGKLEEAMGFAQNTLATMRGMSVEHDAVLGDVFALVAYEEPSRSPLLHLLSKEHRGIVADIVNTALAGESMTKLSGHASSSRCPPNTALQRLLKQLVAVHGSIVECNGGQGERFTLDHHLHKGVQVQT